MVCAKLWKEIKDMLMPRKSHIRQCVAHLEQLGVSWEQLIKHPNIQLRMDVLCILHSLLIRRNTRTTPETMDKPAATGMTLEGADKKRAETVLTHISLTIEALMTLDTHHVRNASLPEESKGTQQWMSRIHSSAMQFWAAKEKIQQAEKEGVPVRFEGREYVDHKSIELKSDLMAQEISQRMNHKSDEEIRAFLEPRATLNGYLLESVILSAESMGLSTMLADRIPCM